MPHPMHRGPRHIPYLRTTSIFKGLEMCNLKTPEFLKENQLSHSEKIKVEKRKEIHLSLFKET